MKQVCRVLSTYASDAAGVCSALYELGGMTIMYDASGCNSTYTTHDEPRWYDMESMLYISPISELDAVMGNDNRLINDAVTTAKELNPKFISLVGTVIPMLAGTDFKGIAKVVGNRTGIKTFGFKTNGMRSYISGAAMAFEKIAEEYCETISEDQKNDRKNISVNLLGLTPLDFSIAGTVEEIRKLFEINDISIISTFAMGSSLNDIKNAGLADVNVVLSSTGILAARKLKEKFKTPYICGVPMGIKYTDEIICEIKNIAAKNGEVLEKPDITKEFKTTNINDLMMGNNEKLCIEKDSKILIIGEEIISNSIKNMLELDFGLSNIKVMSPFEEDETQRSEDVIEEEVKKAELVIADPLYKRITPKQKNIQFIGLPHEAYSGRCFRKDIPVMAGESFYKWFKERL